VELEIHFRFMTVEIGRRSERGQRANSIPSNVQPRTSGRRI
jgi:hypothetical protein